MARLIDADALIEKMHFDVCTDCLGSIKGCGNCYYDRAINAIEDAPTVDAVAVVHGEWRPIDNGRISECSRCLTWVKGAGLYCPNCGAKMDIGKQNEHLRPVVQCRDCKSWQRNSDSLNGHCSCHGITTNYDGSCKDGERTVSAILTVKKYNTDSNFNKRKDKNK